MDVTLAAPNGIQGPACAFKNQAWVYEMLLSTR